MAHAGLSVHQGLLKEQTFWLPESLRPLANSSLLIVTMRFFFPPLTSLPFIFFPFFLSNGRQKAYHNLIKPIKELQICYKMERKKV